MIVKLTKKRRMEGLIIRALSCRLGLLFRVARGWIVIEYFKGMSMFHDSRCLCQDEVEHIEFQHEREIEVSTFHPAH